MRNEYCCTHLCISHILIRSMLEEFLKFRGLGENLRREFLLNSLASNAPFFGEMGIKKRTIFTMKFDMVNLFQNAWFKSQGIKRSTLFNYKQMFFDGVHKAVNGNSEL